jgi:hypothetical protein
MPQAFYILFGAVFTASVCFALGSLLLRALHLKFHRGEERVFAFVAGAPLLSLLVFVLTAAGLARKGVFLAAGLVAIAAALLRGAHRSTGDPLPPLPRFWRILSGSVFAVFTVLYFFNAMSPEMSPDGSTYHLGLVSRYLRERGFPRITTNMYANLSQGVEMLFLFAFAFGRHSAAALVHFAFLATLPAAMLFYARRFGFPAAGAAGAVFVFASPVVGLDGSTAYIDVAVATVLFVLFYLLQVWDRERIPALLVPVGILAGFTYAAKYTAALAIPYALCFVGWKLWRARKPVLRPVLLIFACAAASMVPWMAKNAIVLGNPVSPFLNAVFPNPYVHVAFEEEYSRLMRNYQGLRSRWDIPLEITLRGSVLCGLLGPLFLLAPLALLSLRRPAGRQLLLAAAVFGAAYGANIGTRFLIPALPFLSLAMGLAVSQWKNVAAGLILAHALLSWPDVLKLYCDPHAWRLDKVPVRQALRLESEESWLQRKMPAYHAARLVEEKVPPGEPVLTFTPAPDAYTTRELRVVYQSAANSALGDILWTPLIFEYQPTWHLRFRFPRRPLRKIRLVQTERGGPDQWSVSELRVYLGDREVPRASYWRLTARPNPWEIEAAFDNSPATRWKTGRTLLPGQFIEVDFGGTEEIDSVVAESARDQYRIRLGLEGQDAAGNWVPLANPPEEFEVPRQLGLRKLAAEELKARRIRYLLIFDRDFGAEDFLKNARLWGLTPLGERAGARVYRLD